LYIGLTEILIPCLLLLSFIPKEIQKDLNLNSCRIYDDDVTHKQMAVELTQRLREFDPVDPVKYDFALFAFGDRGAFLKILISMIRVYFNVTHYIPVFYK